MIDASFTISAPMTNTPNSLDPKTAAGQSLALCLDCGDLSPFTERRCPRCHSHLALRKPRSIQRTLALLITAILLYIPANTLPIMTTQQFGAPQPSTIIGGIIELSRQGSHGIAAIIFVASILVPIAKILILLWLCFLASVGARYCRPNHSKLYAFTELIGRWSMIDVCVVAVLVALVQMGQLMTVTPGPAGLPFAGVVISTMLAANAFDPRLLWDAIYKQSHSERTKHA